MSAGVRTHVEGSHACEARGIWNAFRDAPERRRAALLAAMRRDVPAPCGHPYHSRKAVSNADEG